MDQLLEQFFSQFKANNVEIQISMVMHVLSTIKKFQVLG